jgi:Zn-dependent metalloprotease
MSFRQFAIAMILAAAFFDAAWAQTRRQAGQSRTSAVEVAKAQLLADTNGDARVAVSQATGTARFVRLGSGPRRLTGVAAALTGSVMARSHQFLSSYGAIFGVRDVAVELVLATAETDHMGGTHLTYHQRYRGLPVFAGMLRSHFGPAGQLEVVNGTFVPEIDLDPKPILDAEDASRIAIAKVERDLGRLGLSARGSDLMVFREGLARGRPGPNHLAFRVEVGNGGDVREFVFIDAQRGTFIEQFTGINDALHRRAFDGQGTTLITPPNYPSVPFWVEGTPFPTGNPEGDNIISASKETYDLFNRGFGRDSFNKAGATMDAIFGVGVVGGKPCPNASWNGTYIASCAGLTSDDVVGHEWTHAYTDYAHGLIYAWQPGALNEAYSDIFGETIDLINGRDAVVRPQTPRATGACSIFTQGSAGTDNSERWLLGEDVTGPSAGAMRDMWNPACYGQPAKVSHANYSCDVEFADQGGVHTNSGVPNHAFSLLADGGTYNGQTVAPLGLTKAAHIYFRAMSVYQVPVTDFGDHADALEQSCADLRMAGLPLIDLSTGAPSDQVVTSSDCAQVSAAIQAVELRTPSVCTPIFASSFESAPLWDGWAVTNTRYHSASHSLTDSPNGNYASGANNSAWSPPIDLTTRTKARLTFWHRYDMAGGDFANVWIQDVQTQDYEQLASFSGSRADWQQDAITLTAFLGRTIRVVFQVHSDAADVADGWYVDDVAVDVEGPPPSTSGLLGEDSGADDGSSTLFRLDKKGGASFRLGETAFSDVTDIAYTPDGTLYGVTFDRLLRIAPVNGQAFSVGTGLGFDGVNGLAADSSGALYAATLTGDVLRVDPVSGRGTRIGNYGNGLTSVGDLAFSAGGVLYATAGLSATTPILVTVNLSTGVATPIGPVGFGHVYGLAFDSGGRLLGVANGDRGSVPILIAINLLTGLGQIIEEIGGANGMFGLTHGGSLTVPDAPTHVSAASGDGQVAVTFMPPVGDGGAPITSYTAACGSRSNFGPASPITVSGLTNGVAVTCTVLATNDVGNSAPSTASNSVTPTAVVGIAIADATVSEGYLTGSTMTFVVTLTPAAGGTTTVDWTTQELPPTTSASAGTDFTAATGTVTFAAGESRKTISVAILGDAIVEPNETLIVALSNPVGATIGDATAIGAILNDDGATISVTDFKIAEGTGAGTTNLAFTVINSQTASTPITIQYTTSDGTATAGSDYTTTAGTLVLEANYPSGIVNVPVTRDSNIESNETLFLNLTSATGATIFDNQGIGTIEADDGLLVSIADKTSNEGDTGNTPVTFTLTVNSSAHSGVSVDWATADGTATQPLDYVAANGTVTFAAGETTKTLTVQIVGETGQESYETFFVNLSNPVGVAVGDGQAQGTITNTDGSTDRSRLMFHNFSTNRLYRWHMRNGNTLDTFNWVTPWSTDVGWTVGAVADFDRDGQLDYLWHNTNTGKLLVWYIDGDNLKGYLFPFTYDLDVGWSVATVFDANGDGASDIVYYDTRTSGPGSSATSGNVRVVLHDNGTMLGEYTLSQNLPVAGTVRVVNSADANGDGDDELILYNSATGQVSAWDVSGATVGATINYANLQDTTNAFNLVSTRTDFDDDGLADFLWHNPTPTGIFSVWFMNGTTRLSVGQFQPFTATDPVWKVVGSANIW